MNTAQEQVTTDANAIAAAAAAMENAAIDLNAANKVLEADLSKAEYAKVHEDLAKTSGVLTTAMQAASAAQAAAVTWVNDNPPVTPTPPSPPATTVPGVPTGLVATAGNGEVELSWKAPASNGENAATSYNVYAGSAEVVVSTEETSVTVENLTNGTAYEFEVAAVNSAGSSAMTAAVSVTPIAPVTPPPSNAPVPMMSEYSSYVLAEGGDFEFAEMATSTGVIPTGWTLSPSSQISGPSDASNVAIINGQGLVLTCSDASNGAGGSIETSGDGFKVSGAFYREMKVTMPALVDNQTVNQIGLWMLTTVNNGELDIVITGWGNCSGNLETGNESQYASHNSSYLVNGLPPVGEHIFAASYDNVPSHGVNFFMDGKQVGSTLAWPSEEAPTSDPEWFLILTNQGASPAGINGATGKTVVGEAGQVIIGYDRTFVPA